MALQELRIAEIRALSNLGGTFLEVAGKLVMRHGRRLYDHANHPDPMLDLEEAAIRFHTRGSSGEWQDLPSLSVNRTQLLLLAPRDEGDAAIPAPRGQGRQVLLNIISGPLQITGATYLPLDATISEYIHQSSWRFLPLARATIKAHQSGISLGDFEGGVAVCYVNTGLINACVESGRPAASAGQAAPETARLGSAVEVQPVAHDADQDAADGEAVEDTPDPAAQAE